MFVLSDLPYPHASLEPVLSRTTLETHHGKHHKKYVDTLNDLLAKEGRRPASLEEVIRDAGPGKLFNNAAQTWNHGFFWECMAPDHEAPSGDLAGLIEAYGGLDKLREDFVTEGAGHFASGWVWITLKDGALAVPSTHDAMNTLSEDEGFPLLVCDVWEHAYYLDHKQDRKGFLEAWFDRLANWRFAASQLSAAQSAAPGWTYPAPR
ncbi:superoxide dismutase [Brevundimonas sp.]|uniref:superoxide dismutase n=1 Tax=Brevundimonas sp. TaxID=1871086 RepID=UPI0025EC56FD|nr:superoxide dismutase [Brevundimonas sp.]